MAADPRLYFLRRDDLATILFLGVAQAAVLIAWIVCVWQAIDAIAAMQGDVMLPVPWLAALVLLALANAVLRAVEFSVCERIGFEAVRRLRMRIHRHMLGMAPRQIQHRSRGSLLLRMSGDLTMLRTWISRGIGRGTIGAIVLVAGLAAIAWISTLMAVVALLVFLLAAALSLTLGRRLRRVTAAVRRRRSLLTSNIDEQIHSLAVVQLFGRASGEHARLARQNDALTWALVREARIRGRMRGISAGAGWLAVVAVLAAGLVEVAEGYISIGMLVAAATGVRHLTGPLRSLGFAHDYWRRAWVSRRKILDFLASGSRPLADPLHQELRVRRGRIEFDAVTVAGALHDFTATVAPHERIAVVGPSGAGKSTLLGLVARLVEPDEGEVLIDGKPLGASTLLSSFRHIGMVASDLPLMRGTVRRNLTYRRPWAAEAEIWQVLTACRLDAWAVSLPQGLDSWITEGGANIAAGERQRLALARAMLGYPQILLLDEPSANLDEAGRDVLREVVGRYPGTILLATHDMAEAELMDRIWRIEAGRLVETLPGRHGRERPRQDVEDLVPAHG